MVDRARFLVAFWRELRRKTKFNAVDPRQLNGRHVECMVARWLDRRLATATIHNYLSFLRTYAGWIGKPGLVRPPAYYVGADSPHAHRSYVATEDHSWTASNVDIEAKIQEVSAFDPNASGCNSNSAIDSVCEPRKRASCVRAKRSSERDEALPKRRAGVPRSRDLPAHLAWRQGRSPSRRAHQDRRAARRPGARAGRCALTARTSASRG